MENQNRLMQRISRMFRSSFGSCKSRSISDVIEQQPVSVPQKGQLIERFSPNTHPFPSISRPKSSDGDFLLHPVGTDGGLRCPPTSPTFSLDRVHDFAELESKPKKERSRKKKNKNTYLRANNSDDYCGWFSIDGDVSEAGEYDKTTLFSSKSLTSDSPDSFDRDKERRRAASEVGMIPLQEKVRNSFVVVKRSNDPYNDFRASMVEMMILEKEIFEAKELENLLHTFLSLNSHHHHRVIIKVFTDIWDKLFFNRWS